jgi:hypothetical protein
MIWKILEIVLIWEIQGVWRSKEDADKGLSGPAHGVAMRATRALYTHWKVERWRLAVEENVGDWTIETW